MKNLDIAWERSKILRDWREYVIKIVEASREVFSEDLVGVYVFGSAVSGKLVATSDIDLLIVARNLPASLLARTELKERIEVAAGLPLIHPFEIHLVSEEEAKIYFRHIGRNYLKLY
ncbi:MAG: nucleotidyltransferase domain-containing protein [Infirmifilum uzonense]|uniref:nucleotidyltransferase domain-containing protein n=1 Tax=Infirmifilum TaxID=2856573 RepID=UPI003C778DA4